MDAESDDAHNDARIAAALRDILDQTVNRLEAAHAPDQVLATYIPPRRGLLMMKKAIMEPLGRAWRLGVFLLKLDGTLYATGSITNASEPGHPNFQSLSGEDRRAVRAAAARGPFTVGETINYDAPMIRPDVSSLRSSSGPLFIRGDHVMVRWSPSLGDGSAVEFVTYLAERVDLLMHPPEGS